MTKENNIRAILETYFTGFKEEIMDSAANRLMEITEKERQGRWITVENDIDYYPFMCSECYETVTKKTKFCPNCGAKMVNRDG